MASFGGRILCDSVAGQYTTFTLEFPMVEDHPSDDLFAAPAPRQAEQEAAASPPHGP
jgi:hypothetical protein